jgi:hypothetical protein
MSGCEVTHNIFKSFFTFHLFSYLCDAKLKIIYGLFIRTLPFDGNYLFKARANQKN